jgi:hypothetical protein
MYCSQALTAIPDCPLEVYWTLVVPAGLDQGRGSIHEKPDSRTPRQRRATSSGDDASRWLDHMNSYRLRAALAANGWPDRYLSFNRRSARIDLRNGITGFVRLLHQNAFMPVDRILTPGTLVEFDPVLSGIVDLRA